MERNKKAKPSLNASWLAAAVLLAVVFTSDDAASGREAEKGMDPLEALYGMEAAYGKVNDYTAVFLKRERVKGRLLPEETIRFKFRKPFKVYMKWLEGPHEGREALYVQGRYDNKVVGHEGGVIGFITLHMEPMGGMAMRGNRHPITDVGIGRLIEIVLENVRRAQKEGVLELEPQAEEALFGRKAFRLATRFPRGLGYYCGSLVVWVDAEHGLPVRIMVYGWEGELLESYGYRDLRLNPGLSEEEFDEDYEGYGF